MFGVMDCNLGKWRIRFICETLTGANKLSTAVSKSEHDRPMRVRPISEFIVPDDEDYIKELTDKL